MGGRDVLVNKSMKFSYREHEIDFQHLCQMAQGTQWPLSHVCSYVHSSVIAPTCLPEIKRWVHGFSALIDTARRVRFYLTQCSAAALYAFSSVVTCALVKEPNRQGSCRSGFLHTKASSLFCFDAFFNPRHFYGLWVYSIYSK